MSTICAISTPNAVGGISVIRISGNNAINIASEIFKPFGDKKVLEMKGHTCVYGRVVNDEGVVDDALLTVFRAPKSYTGEDTAEISCHGGIYVTQKVLRTCLEHGAELALPGEFTKRAFLNGKLSLTQAEAVADIISAQGEQSRRSAVLSREGVLYKNIKAVSDRVKTVLGELSAWVDYPDEDIPEVEEDTLKETVSTQIKALENIVKSYDRGRIFREGIDTVIAGKPNAGKSTLMNMLLGYDRSIVTDLAGTTRDVIEESVRLGDVVLRLSDTAGIQKTEDLVEGIGIDRAKKKIENCELMIAVFDRSRELDSDDEMIISLAKKVKSIAVINKTDLEAVLDEKKIRDAFEKVIEISAKNYVGTDEIEKAVLDVFSSGEFDSTSLVFANERQKNCAEKALKYLKKAYESLMYGDTLDAVTVMLEESLSAILELTGEKVNEAVVNEVFSHFCVGK